MGLNDVNAWRSGDRVVVGKRRRAGMVMRPAVGGGGYIDVRFDDDETQLYTVFHTQLKKEANR